MVSAFLCAICVLLIMWGISDHWPWWSFVPLAILALVFFLAEADED